MTVEVRLTLESDIPSCREVIAAVAAERRYILMLEAPPLERVQNFVFGNIHNNHAQYVAVDSNGDDEKVVGWAEIVPKQRESLSHIGTLGMGILEDYRGQGIGGRLLD